MRVLVESRADVASCTIAAAVRRLAGTRPTRLRLDGLPIEGVDGFDDVLLVPIDGLHVHAEGLDGRLASASVEPSEILFLSRHASRSGTPTLTVHPLGNFGPAAVGGQELRFTPAPAARMTQLLRSLAAARSAAGLDVEVAFEVTHHGPLLATPACFVELGSTPAQWEDAAGARVVAEAVLAALETPLAEAPVAIGLGGGHYAPRFTEAALGRSIHYGHLWPRHAMRPEADLAAILGSLAHATPGVSAVHEHQSPAPLRPALREAAAELGLGPIEPSDLPPAPAVPLRQGHQ